MADRLNIPKGYAARNGRRIDAPATPVHIEGHGLFYEVDGRLWTTPNPREGVDVEVEYEVLFGKVRIFHGPYDAMGHNLEGPNGYPNI